jgi:hypothetical protein
VTPQPTPEANNDENTADILVQTLIDWGATHVFGIVGDGINSIIEALRRRQDRIRYVPVRHEEAAAFMACGFAKHTGRLGVCVGTTGPGAIHLMNGIGKLVGDYSLRSKGQSSRSISRSQAGVMGSRPSLSQARLRLLSAGQKVTENLGRSTERPRRFPSVLV